MGTKNSSNKHPNLTEKELEEMSRGIIKEFPRVISNLLLKRIRISRVNEEEMIKELTELIKELIEGFKEIERIQSKPLPEEKKISLIYPLLDKIMRKADPTIPEDQHVTDYYVELLEHTLQIPSDLIYFKNTNYFGYGEAVEKILLDGFKQGKVGLIGDFLEDIGKTDDALVITQSVLPLLTKHYDYLKKEHKYVGKRQIERYIKIYDEFSGLYEKFLSMVVGLLEILENKTKPDYLKIRRNSLGFNMKKVWRGDYRILTEGFNRNVRNAIAHKTYTFDIWDKKIDFTDLNRKINVSYNDFKNEVRELSALVYVFFQFRLLYTYYLLTSAQKYISQFIQKS